MLPAHNQAFLLLCLFCLGVMVAGITAPINAAEVYRWKDDSGKIVYGDKPPNDKPSTPVTVKNTENTGAQFATTGQVKKLERDAQKGRRATRSPPPSHRRPLSELRQPAQQGRNLSGTHQHTA